MPHHRYAPWLCALVFLLKPIPSRAAGKEPSPTSVVRVPVEVNLSSLRNELEAALPREAGQWRDWERYRGWDVRYRLWRGPVDLRMWDDVLYLAVPIGYWVKVRKSILKPLKIKGSCGIDEPPRGLAIRLASRLRWRGDWRLQSQTAVLPTQYFNPCRMSIANIDVTPMLDTYLRRKLVNLARETIDRRVPTLTPLTSAAESAWKALLQPFAVAPDTWLLLNPRTVSIAPLRGQGTTVSTSLAVGVRPALMFGEPPETEDVPLPALTTAPVAPGGLRLRIGVDLSHRTARDALNRWLPADEYLVGSRRIRVSEIDLAGAEGQIVLTLHLKGDVDGILVITGRPAFDAELREIRLQGLELQLTEGEPALKAAAALFAEPIRLALASRARWPIGDELARMRGNLETALNRSLSSRARLETKIEELTPADIRVTESGLRVEMDVSARTRVLVQ